MTPGIQDKGAFQRSLRINEKMGERTKKGGHKFVGDRFFMCEHPRTLDPGTLALGNQDPLHATE